LSKRPFAREPISDNKENNISEKDEAGQMKKIAIGCDPNASGLKEAIKKHLSELGYEWEDYGSDDRFMPMWPSGLLRLCSGKA
jgi:hypothetical protein